MEKKQTAVEWYIEQRNLLENDLRSNLFGLGAYFQRKSEIEKQAKQMEKEQIVDGWLNGMKGEMIAPLSINNYKSEAEDYYNETYGGTE